MNDGPCSEGSKLGHPLSIPSVENSGSPVVYSSIHLEDSISAVTFSGSSAQEVVLRVSLRFGSSQVRSIPCVVDTGAGGNYLLISKINDCEGWGITEIPPISVSLADGSVSQIRYGIRCSIAVQDCDGVVITDYKECTLRCLLCSSLSSEDEWRVLAGRDLVNLWGLVLYGTRRAFIAGNCVFSATPDEAVPDGPDDMICRVIESGCTVNHTSSESGLDVPPASKSQVDRVICPLASREEEAHIGTVLTSLTDKSWFPIPGTKQAYHCRIRRLWPCEVVDIPGHQTHVCEVRIPAVSHVPRSGRSYSKSLYLRLPETLKRDYAALIQSYVDSKWWVEAPPTLATPTPPAQIFLVPPSSQARKSRLVIDFRELNKALPRAGAGGESPMLFHVLGLLRTESRETTLLCDCRSAFYKVRLVDLILTLESALGSFLSSRMGFGILFGPCGLNGCLSPLVSESRLPGFGGIELLHMVLVLVFLFVDDLALSGPTLPTVVKFKLLLILLLRVGFDAQQRKVYALAVDCRKEELKKALESCGIDLSIAEEGVILGVKIAYRGDFLVLNCDRSRRLSVVIGFVRMVASGEAFTKRLGFKAAGCLAFDPARLHPISRACADGVRSLLGRCFSQLGWSDPLDVSRLSESSQAAWKCLVDWMQNICTHDSAVCSHRSPVRFADAPELKIRAYCDASLTGGGFIAFVDDVELFSEAFLWRRAERRWHSNRRELCVLLRLLQNLCDFLHYRRRIVPQGNPQGVHITIFCDNAACVAWSQDSERGDLIERSKGVERRAIARLVSGLHDELLELRHLCKPPTSNPSPSPYTVEISHLPGCSNDKADTLSRIYDRRTEAGKSLADCLADATGILDERARDPTRMGCGWDKLNSDKDPLVADWHPSSLEKTDEKEVSDKCCFLADWSTVHSDSWSVNLCALAVCHGAPPADVVYHLQDSEKLWKPLMECESLVDRASRYSYDLDDALHLLWFVKTIIYMLKANVKETLHEFRQPSYDGTAVRYIAARSCQLSDPRYTLYLSGAETLVCCGPLYLSSSKELGSLVSDSERIASYPPTVVYRSGTASGRVVLKPVIPRGSSCARFRSLVIRVAHRSCVHGGADGTCAQIVDFHLPAGLASCRDFIKQCLICQISRAKRVWVNPMSLGVRSSDGSTPADLLRCPPYWRVGVDFFCLGMRCKVLTCTCLMSGHVTMVRCDEDARSSVKALRRIQLLRGGLREVYTDTASYFMCSAFTRSMQKELGAAVYPLNARSPHEGGKYEKLHDLAARKLRVLLRDCVGKVASKTDEEVDELLLRCCHLLNSRPIGSFYFNRDGVKSPVSPNVLAFGYEHHTGAQFGVESAPCSPGRDQRAVRDAFEHYHWQRMKEKSITACRSKCPKNSNALQLEVGDTVLVYTPPNRKLAFHWRLAHVAAIRTNRSIQVVYPNDQRLCSENIYNVVKVDHEVAADCVLPEERDFRWDCEREDDALPSRIGMCIEVALKVRGEKTKRWYPAKVSHVWASGHVTVNWFDGDPPERLWLEAEDWYILDGEPIEEGRDASHCA